MATTNPYIGLTVAQRRTARVDHVTGEDWSCFEEVMAQYDLTDDKQRRAREEFIERARIAPFKPYEPAHDICARMERGPDWFPVIRTPAAWQPLVGVDRDGVEYAGLTYCSRRCAIIEPISNELASRRIALSGWLYEGPDGQPTRTNPAARPSQSDQDSTPDP